MPATRHDDNKDRLKSGDSTSPQIAGRRWPDSEPFRPSEFMRARRPHLFSDTKAIEFSQLDRAVLDHHLETLTSRKQELIFERFARKLAEREICPNLIPQTGPTGGGDSKVDAETYPVSDNIALRWYEGDSNAAQERWGFAISAKKAWKSKLAKDVASIAETSRGYVRVYFITNQYVKDKDRADKEDGLRKHYGFDVHILDRTWILEKVFANRREQLAVDTLELDRPFTLREIKGPRDTLREAELQELEQQINDPARYQGIEYQLVEDCLQTAFLARGLERPRVELDGRFERARRMAETYGTNQQRLRVAYGRAWTLFWWYEDYSTFLAAYGDVEELAKGSAQAVDIGLLKNLWQLLYAAVDRNDLDLNSVKLGDRTAILRNELQRLQRDETRRTTALLAKAQELLVDLFETKDQKESRERILTEFQSIFDESKGMIDFPVRQFIQLITEIGEQFSADAAFDKTFETVVTIAQERDSRQTAGRMLLTRALQLIEHQRPYEAIRYLGRAQPQLAIRECRSDFVNAFASCAGAYESVGLLWAAHASMLLAASKALQDFWEDGTVTRQAHFCLRRLAWLDLQLGRVSSVLAWLETASAVKRAIDFDSTQQESLRKERMHLDLILGILLLKTDYLDLKGLAPLPTTLAQFNLDFAWTALLYALGYENRLREENVLPQDDTSEKVSTIFSEAVAQEETIELPQPDFLDKQKVRLHSSVLGCKVTVEVPNKDQSLFLAEAFLAALEAFLATSLDAALVPYTPHLNIRITPADSLAVPLDWIVSETHPLIEIRHSTDVPDAQTVHDLLPELIIAVTTRLVVPTDITHFEVLFRDEQAMGRALCLTNIDVATTNILGKNPKLRISDWVDYGGETFPLLRNEPWKAVVTPTRTTSASPTLGMGAPPEELLDIEKVRHPDLQVMSLINIPLWAKAGWKGVGYIDHPDLHVPPLMALLFEGKEAGRHIFAAWRSELGQKDSENKLRITIITGIDREHPAHYRVLVSSNWDAQPRASRFAVVSQPCTMTPRTSENLDRFLARYRMHQAYLLTPGHMEPNESIPSFSPDLAITCSYLHVRPAFEISENDPDIIGLRGDDNIIVPQSVDEAAVLRTLERIRQRKHARERSPVHEGPQLKVGRNEFCPCGSGKKFKKCHGA